MDKIEIAILRKLINYVLVTMNWFIRRCEKKQLDREEQQHVQKLKVMIKELEVERDELEREEE